MGIIEAVYENGVFKPLKKVKAPKRVKLVIIKDFERDLEEVFGILSEDIDVRELRKEWDRNVSY
ncbi:antitoxin family protein [Thermococcus sp. SY098]|uniref:antitoxin family protein n=1 Tax=Thermococcus sp. SY098 TaxID=3111325 RepID=UPI002D77143F|nr:antitoxin family protein [Thermococcus sp. SY098]WRS53171.1 antitoxin family protein [Thermococcus sp. SY098]